MVVTTIVGQSIHIHLNDSTYLFEMADIDSITFGIDEPQSFPVTAELFLDHTFSVCEGIAFNGEEQLFVAGDHSLWMVSTAGELTHLFDAYSNLGLAPSGPRQILFADFGPTNAFVSGYNRDGIVWLVSPEGNGSIAATNMGDPNFILKLDNGNFLVSDDATDEIFIVDENGESSIFTQAVNHPNGMVQSLDGEWLYVAQMFQAIHPSWVFDGSVWAIRMENYQPTGDPVEIIDLGDNAGIDGLAQDIFGRLYIACWNAGSIWRYNPENQELLMICDNVPGVASLAFGRGGFDTNSIYATSTTHGSVWKIPVGVSGAPLYR